MRLSVLDLRGSFRAKVAGIALATTIAAMLAAVAFSLMQGWRAERQQLVHNRGVVAQVLAYNLSASLVFGDANAARNTLESVRYISSVRSARVYDKAGRLFAQLGDDQGARPIADLTATTPSWRFSDDALEYQVPVIVDHERVGALVLVSGLDDLWALLRKHLLIAGLSFAVATGLALITGFWLARIIIQPVARLAGAMDRVRRSGGFEHAVPRTSEDEVGRLTDAFNDLLGELKHNDQSLRKAFEDLRDSQDAIRNLLDNAEQGFLTVAPDLTVGEQSSAACAVILGAEPAGRTIISLLFGEAAGGVASSMRATLESVFRDADDFTRSLKIELLPREFSLDGKFIRAGYKFLTESGRLMLILTDVTQTRLLTLEVERERKRLEMIVLAVTEGEAVSALAGDYRAFLEDELPRLIERFDDPAAPRELYRRFHTFKGLLAQFSFPHSPICLHEAEARLASRSAWTAGAARRAFASDALTQAFELDLASLTDALGADVLTASRRLSLSQSQLEAMEKVASLVLAGEEGRSLSPPLRLLLQTLGDLGRLDVKTALAVHGRGALSLAAHLEKQLAPITVRGDDIAVDPARYSDFFRSLVHLFRNAVDHGIETPDERLMAGKPADGSILCDIRHEDDWLEIDITDDGQGIDRERLEDLLTAAGEDPLHVEALSLEEMVFRQGLSSRDMAGEVSGRGIGLSAIKVELDRLGGVVVLTSERGVGSRFRFRLPTGPNGPTHGSDAGERTAR